MRIDSSDISDADEEMENTKPAPLIAYNTSSSGTSQSAPNGKTQSIPELARSVSSPSTGSGNYSSRQKPSRPPPISLNTAQRPQKTRSPDPTTQFSRGSSRTSYSGQGAIIGAVPSLERQPDRQNRAQSPPRTQRGASSRQNVHQPKRHNEPRHQSPRRDWCW